MRRTETSTLAFLDVMACGLGAVILILVVLKQQAPPDVPPQPEPIVSSEQAEADLNNLQILPHILKGAKIADIMAILGSIVVIMGSVDR